MVVGVANNWRTVTWPVCTLVLYRSLPIMGSIWCVYVYSNMAVLCYYDNHGRGYPETALFALGEPWSNLVSWVNTKIVLQVRCAGKQEGEVSIFTLCFACLPGKIGQWCEFRNLTQEMYVGLKVMMSSVLQVGILCTVAPALKRATTLCGGISCIILIRCTIHQGKKL